MSGKGQTQMSVKEDLFISKTGNPESSAPCQDRPTGGDLLRHQWPAEN